MKTTQIAPHVEPRQRPSEPGAARWGYVAPVTCYAAPGRRWRGVTLSGALVYGETADAAHKQLRDMQTC